MIAKTKHFQYFSKHRKQFHLLRINNAYETIYKKKKRKKKEKRKMKNSSLSESESKFERVISSFFTRETLLECTARNKAVTSVLNLLYSTRTWFADSSHGITSVFLLFKHTASMKLTSTNRLAMSSNADFRSPESEASRRRCETSTMGSLLLWVLD